MSVDEKNAQAIAHYSDVYERDLPGQVQLADARAATGWTIFFLGTIAAAATLYLQYGTSPQARLVATTTTMVMAVGVSAMTPRAWPVTGNPHVQGLWIIVSGALVALMAVNHFQIESARWAQCSGTK